MSSSPASSIFADPRGHRRRLLQIATFFLSVAFLAAATYFISSLLIAPKLYLPQTVREYRTHLQSKPFAASPLLEMKGDWHHLLPTHPALPFSTNLNGSFNSAVISALIAPQKPIFLEEKITTSSSSFPIRLGYAAAGDTASDISLNHNADLLTHVASDWFSLVGVEQNLVEEPNSAVATFCAHKGIGLLLILRNLDGDVWQPEAVEGLLKASPKEQTSFFDHLLQRLPTNALGVLVEWSEIDTTYRPELAHFFAAWAAHFHAHHRELWITIPSGKAQEAYDLDSISQAADHLVATLYDENCQPDDAGPLADMEWFQESLQELQKQGNPEKWIIALGAYGTDWNDTKETLESVSFVDAMARASVSTADSVTVEPPSFSPHFNYSSESQDHEVWFLDAITFYNQLHVLEPYHLGGIGIYRLGQEDPDLWKALRLTCKMEADHRDQPTPAELHDFETLKFKHQIASIGSGDFLSAGDESIDGYRSVDVGEDHFLTTTYEKFPRPACVYRQGIPGPHQVALTFDDGPDPTWTPRILKILKEKQAPATFFILGCQAQQFPDLVQLVQREGYEFGNHTYTHQNLGETSDDQICLELNATTRLLESITGHSTTLFRPPFNGDGNPSTPGELRAIQVASDLGYLTVGESIDPNDWEQPGVETILQRVKDQRAAGGSIILLHDAGGNRSQTVAALPQIIDYLHARGDEIVPLSTIIGLSNDILMPRLRQADVTIATRYIYGSFAVFRFLEMIAWSLLIIAALLSLFQILFFITCALRHRARERAGALDHVLKFPEADEVQNISGLQQLSVHEALESTSTRTTKQFPASVEFKDRDLPALSVIIAAYNEERVIASTIEHLLASDYDAPLELIIVDDGSHDTTASLVSYLVKTTTQKNRTVSLIQQPNTGKATALNRAIAASHHEFLVTLDADTMVIPTALRELVRPFSDESVGAISGHIRVGNLHQWLGRFQQIEYEFAFEINRRAQDLLGCITVVPGALSAFRRTALAEAGPFQTETLAEDTDLTLQLHRCGWKITYAPLALADTEAPASIKALLSQRFRWAFGTLQCLWKHRSLTLSPGSGWLGWFALPSIWVFQVGIIAITPLLDLMVLCSLFWGGGKAIWPYFCASLVLDIGLAACAAHFAKRSAWSAWRALPMRLLYRPLLGYIVWKCLLKAAAGSWVRWSKLERTAAAIKEKESF